MKKIIIPALLAIVAVCTSSCRFVRFNEKAYQDYLDSHLIAKGPSTEEVRSLESFEHLSLVSSFDVDIVKAEGEPSVKIYAPANVIQYIGTSVSGGVLLLNWDFEGSQYRSANVNDSDIKITVYAPAIKQVVITGSGDIKIGEGVCAESFEVNISGSGDIEGRGLTCKKLMAYITGSGDIDLSGIDCEELTASISGSGDIELSGRTDKAEFIVRGSGDIDAKGLNAGSVSQTVRGSGDISL